MVDSGHRGESDLLSTELAELGLSSVTTSVEAADAVLDVIDPPAAIFVNTPSRGDGLAVLRELAATLRGDQRVSGIPVIEWNRDIALASGGVSAILTAAIGVQALSGPEL